MQAERIDALLLQLLNEAAGPWHVGELEREFGRRRVEVRDGLARLLAAGLAHRIDGDYWFASAAGRYANDLWEER